VHAGRDEERGGQRGRDRFGQMADDGGPS
jgi:hypothetical protein